LYYVGVAHERLERADVAIGIYEELIGREAATSEIRSASREALRRLRSGNR
jgi:hypothetical protein